MSSSREAYKLIDEAIAKSIACFGRIITEPIESAFMRIEADHPKLFAAWLKESQTTGVESLAAFIRTTQQMLRENEGHHDKKDE